MRLYSTPYQNIRQMLSSNQISLGPSSIRLREVECACFPGYDTNSQINLESIKSEHSNDAYLSVRTTTIRSCVGSAPNRLRSLKNPISTLWKVKTHILSEKLCNYHHHRSICKFFTYFSSFRDCCCVFPQNVVKLFPSFLPPIVCHWLQLNRFHRQITVSHRIRNHMQSIDFLQGKNACPSLSGKQFCTLYWCINTPENWHLILKHLNTNRFVRIVYVFPHSLNGSIFTTFWTMMGRSDRFVVENSLFFSGISSRLKLFT